MKAYLDSDSVLCTGGYHSKQVDEVFLSRVYYLGGEKGKNETSFKNRAVINVMTGARWRMTGVEEGEWEYFSYLSVLIAGLMPLLSEDIFCIILLL